MNPEQTPSEARSAPTPPLHQQAFDLYKFRAEEHERRLLSFRAIEWQLPFQVYAACGGIALGFQAIRDSEVVALSPQALAAASLAALLLVLAIATFWQYNLIKRIHFNNSRLAAYRAWLHERVIAELPLKPGEAYPPFGFWWAFLPMQVANTLAVAAAAFYILHTTPAP